jgi:hypothetical protein
MFLDGDEPGGARSDSGRNGTAARRTSRAAAADLGGRADSRHSLFGWLVADGCVGLLPMAVLVCYERKVPLAGWSVLREKYRWLVGMF